MPNEPVPRPPVEVRFTPEFKRNIRQLAKKYRRIKTAPADIRQIILDYEAQQPATDSANRETPPPEGVADGISDK